LGCGVPGGDGGEKGLFSVRAGRKGLKRGRRKEGTEVEVGGVECGL